MACGDASAACTCESLCCQIPLTLPPAPTKSAADTSATRTMTPQTQPMTLIALPDLLGPTCSRSGMTPALILLLTTRYHGKAINHRIHMAKKTEMGPRASRASYCFSPIRDASCDAHIAEAKTIRAVTPSAWSSPGMAMLMAIQITKTATVIKMATRTDIGLFTVEAARAGATDGAGVVLGKPGSPITAPHWAQNRVPGTDGLPQLGQNICWAPQNCHLHYMKARGV